MTLDKEQFLASIKEPEYVIVTPVMIEAGLDRLHDLCHEMDQRFILHSIYAAMEYERRRSNS